MWHRAERVFEIANAVLIFAVHMLALYNEAHLTFVELTVLSLNFIVEAGGAFAEVKQAIGEREGALPLFLRSLV